MSYNGAMSESICNKNAFNMVNMVSIPFTSNSLSLHTQNLPPWGLFPMSCLLLLIKTDDIIIITRNL